MNSRPADPADVPVIAHLAYLAGRGHVSTSVYDLLIDGPPGPTKERLERLGALLLAQTAHWGRYSNYTVAEVEGRTVAALCAFATDPGWRRSIVGALREIGWTDGEITAMSIRLEPFLRAEPQMPEDVWVVENAATLPEFRRRGLMRALLEVALEDGRDRGYEHAQISVFIGNTPARRAYEQAGFVVNGESRDPEFEEIFSCPGILRMTKEL